MPTNLMITVNTGRIVQIILSKNDLNDDDHQHIMELMKNGIDYNFQFFGCNNKTLNKIVMDKNDLKLLEMFKNQWMKDHGCFGESSESQNDDVEAMEVDLIDEDSAYDILKYKSRVINPKTILIVSNVGELMSLKEQKFGQKILKISVAFSTDEFFNLLGSLEIKSENFPNLFIFDLEVDEKNFNFEKTRISQDIRKQFPNRPLIIQFACGAINKSSAYQYAGNSNNLTQFGDPSQLDLVQFESSLVNGNCDLQNLIFGLKNSNVDIKILMDIFMQRKELLNLRFLSIFRLSIEDHFDKIVQCVDFEVFCAVLDFPFEFDGKFLNDRTVELIKTVRSDDRCILKCAVDGSNLEIVEFLVKKFQNHLMALPIDHQIRTTNTAKNDKILYLLLLNDFPFPYNFDLNSQTDQVRMLVKYRGNLRQAVKEENEEKIMEFIELFPNTKIAYDLNNRSALLNALDMRKFQMYSFLISKSFKPCEKVDFKLKQLSNIEKHQITSANVCNSLSDDEKHLKLLVIKSKLYNEGQYEELDYKKEAFEKILKWFKELDAVEFIKPILQCAALSEKLSMIFDMKNEFIDKADPSVPKGCLGVTYSSKETIFNAGGGNELVVKQTIIHELSHFVNQQIFQNDFKPYFAGDADKQAAFDECVDECKRNIGVDDGCDGTISVVFQKYNVEDYIKEVAVRVQEVLVHFYGNPSKLNDFSFKYPKLCKYICELLEFIKTIELGSKERVRNLNGYFPTYSQVKSELALLKYPQSIKVDCGNKIFVSNVRLMTILAICHELQKQDMRNLLYSKTIFVDPKELKNLKIHMIYQNTIRSIDGLQVIVNFPSNYNEEMIKKAIIPYPNVNYFLIVEKKIPKLVEFIRIASLLISHDKVEHEFNDFTDGSKKKVGEKSVNFQDCLDIPINQIISPAGYSPSILSALFLSETPSFNLRPSDDGIAVKMKRKNDKIFVERTKTEREVLMTKDEYETEVNVFKKKLEKVRDNPDGSVVVKKIFKEPDKLMTFGEFHQNSKDKQHVVISDIAGSGKTCALKYIERELRDLPRFTFFIQLESFINFLTFQNVDENDFLSFMKKFLLKNVTKNKEKFLIEEKSESEKSLFEDLYKNGRANVLFDGFDEISPVCKDHILKLIKSFESNGGNQLIITTRTHLEVDLEKELKLMTIYSLNPLEEDEQIEYLATCWQKHSNARKMATDLVKKLSVLMASQESNLIGLPQILKILSESYVDSEGNLEQDLVNKFSMYEIYQKSVSIFIRKHRKKYLGGIEKDEQELNSQSLIAKHQQLAMKHFLGSDVRDDIWGVLIDGFTDEQIQRLGIFFSNQNISLVPIHETYYEFFAADFILKYLKSNNDWRYFDVFFGYFVTILLDEKYKIVRLFINDGLDQNSSNDDEKMKNSSKNLFENLKNRKKSILYCTIKERHLKILKFLLELIDKFDKYEDKREILLSKVEELNILTTSINFSLYDDRQVFKDVLTFIIEITDQNQPQFDQETKNLMLRDFKELLTTTQDYFRYAKTIFHHSTKENIHPDVIRLLFDKIRLIVGEPYLVKLLRTIDDDGRNALHFQSTKTNLEKFIVLFEKYEKLLPGHFKVDDHYELTILHFCLKSSNEEVLQYVWPKFTNEEKKEIIKKPIKRIQHKNALKLIVANKNVEIHKTFWKLLKDLFSIEEMEKLILHKDRYLGFESNNFLHCLASFGNSEVIRAVFDCIKNIFPQETFQNLLRSKGYCNRSVLHKAADVSTDVESHRALWEIFEENFPKLQDFLNIITQTDGDNDNLLFTAVAFNEKNVIKFMVEYIDSKNYDLKENFLLNTGYYRYSYNILQRALLINYRPEVHQYLWEVVEEKLNSDEIIQLIKPTLTEDHLLHTAVAFNTLEVVQLTWKKIKEFLPKREYLSYLSALGYANRNLLQNAFIKNRNNPKVHEWVRELLESYNIQV